MAFTAIWEPQGPTGPLHIPSRPISTHCGQPSFANDRLFANENCSSSALGCCSSSSLALRRAFRAAHDFRSAAPPAPIYDGPRLARGREMRFSAFAATDRTAIRTSMSDCRIADPEQQRIAPLSSGAKRQLDQQTRHLKPGLY